MSTYIYVFENTVCILNKNAMILIVTMTKYQTIKWQQWIRQHIIGYTWTFDILEPIRMWAEQVISSELANDKSAYHKNKNEV